LLASRATIARRVAAEMFHSIGDTMSPGLSALKYVKKRGAPADPVEVDRGGQRRAIPAVRSRAGCCLPGPHRDLAAPRNSRDVERGRARSAPVVHHRLAGHTGSDRRFQGRTRAIEEVRRSLPRIPKHLLKSGARTGTRRRRRSSRTVGIPSLCVACQRGAPQSQFRL
jgi:hypothetical protein